MKSTYTALEWIPEAFQGLSSGARHHLPKRKLRLALFGTRRGFFGASSYRRHFFGALSSRRMLTTAILDEVRYSRFWMSRKHRRSKRPESGGGR